ncbi:MAG: DUF4256 domain-containing protein [Flavobacterium sp.]|nr:DUF4256 domain-containing protein [Flavobacterium sp.]
MVKALSSQVQQLALLATLKTRFEQHKYRHVNIAWKDVQLKLEANQQKLEPLLQMELTHGEPDVIGYDATTNDFLFCDCAAESPKGRRSLCYDEQALEARKENKPKHSALALANEMGITLLSETEYKQLQQLEKVDTKTSSWLLTPISIRQLGGAIFGDYRYGQVFIYHNGAESYYAARGFRGLLKV